MNRSTMTRSASLRSQHSSNAEVTKKTDDMLQQLESIQDTGFTSTRKSTYNSTAQHQYDSTVTQDERQGCPPINPDGGSGGGGGNTTKIRRFKILSMGLAMIGGITYPLMKVTLISLASKLVINATSNISCADELFSPLLESSTILLIYIMEPFNFYEVFAVAIVLGLVMTLVTILRTTLDEHYLNYMEVKRLQEMIYDKFILEPNSVDTSEARDLLYTQIGFIDMYWSKIRGNVVEQVTTICFGLVLFMILSWDLGLIILGSTIVIIFATLKTWNKLSSPWAEQREKKAFETNARLLDILTCKDVVLSHTMELEERKLLHEIIHSDSKEISRLCFAKLISGLIRNATFTMLLPMLFLYVYTEGQSLEEVFQLLIIITVMDEMVRSHLSYLRLVPSVEEYARAKKAFVGVLGLSETEIFPSAVSWPCWIEQRCTKRAGDLVKTPKERVRYNDSAKSNSDEECPEFFSAVESKLVHPARNDFLTLEHVSLGYMRKDGSTNEVVKDLNLSFALGSHHALMGESGAGKSTVSKAITGLIPTLKGRIYVSGTPIHPTSSSWRRQVAVVSQESLLFNRSLRENIAYGENMNSVKDGDIMRVLEKVNLTETVMALPDGLDTVVRENGNEFSGGQRQRLQIARLLLSSCPIIVLDEMTSALDRKTTEDVIRELKSFVVGKTLIMITHDIQTLTLTDNVLDMNKLGEVETAVIDGAVGVQASPTKKFAVPTNQGLGLNN